MVSSFEQKTVKEAFRVWQQEASTDRSSFEADKSLRFQQAISSIDYRRIDPALSLSKRRSLTRGGLIRVFDKDSLL
jgi:hypothetical protein